MLLNIPHAQDTPLATENYPVQKVNRTGRGGTGAPGPDRCEAAPDTPPVAPSWVPGPLSPGPLCPSSTHSGLSPFFKHKSFIEL